MGPRIRIGGLMVLALAATASCGPGSALLPGTPPAVVLDAYLTALKEGDCVTAQALTMPGFAHDGELCGAVHVFRSTPLPAPATPQDGEVIFSTTLTTGGDGVSIAPGDVIWFYDLQRQPGGAWRIAGGGSGP